MTTVTVSPVSVGDTVGFATRELVRYLTEMGNSAELCGDGGKIVVGLYPGYDARKDNRVEADEYRIEIDGEARGEILGANPRSVLFGVYGYLQACGCRFLYPGKGGEVIPRARPAAVSCREKPSYHFRCVSIEGANALENILDMIDWLPKAGMNGYHLQLKDCRTFFDRWYGHYYNPLKNGREISGDEADKFVTRIRNEIRLRGISLQYMGHGWVSGALGIETIGWEKNKTEVEAGTMNLLAEIRGRRGLWKNVAVDTNACYSNPAAREKIVGYIADFCAENREVSYVHVWLADDINNFCECENCRRKLPSDWYVMLLNELDQELTERRLDTRIIFLVYCETLWVPEQEKLRNPERFAMIFAPVSLNYTRVFRDSESVGKTAAFRLNQIQEPESAEDNIAYYRQWKKRFSGESFLYIYHLLSCGWEKDVTGYALAEILHSDLVHLADIGLDGVSACQAQRTCFPTGLCMYVQARTLWNRETDLESVTEEYFSAAYGSGWQKIRNILREISFVITPEWLQYETERVSVERAEAFQKLREKLSETEKMCREEKRCHCGARQINWRYMEVFVHLLGKLLPLFLASAYENRQEAERVWSSFLPEMFKYEDELQTVFDMEWFARNFELFQVKGLKHFVNQVDSEE